MPSGDKLGPYEILAPLGKGGMGEVFRARDSRMGRDVAVKLSTEQFSERFDREVRAIAALNHPNVCTLYDVGPNYLIMELIEGPTLAELIQEGALPLDEVLRIARQIAAALEAAHEKGITHRDLKPGNIKITPDGTVKVLDFGLAKVAAASAASSTVGDDSPTLSMAATQTGVILGTAAYMSPEQARGKPVDARADIWAFGVVLFEMATGRRPFQGEDLTETLASVVKEEPDLSAAPQRLRRLLAKCLEKDPNKRLRHISGVDLLLDDPADSSSSAARATAQPNRTGWIAAGVLALALVSIAWVLWPKPAPEPSAQRFSIDAPPDSTFVYNYPGAAISPDGKLMVFAAARGSQFRLWIRPIDSLEARELPGTENGNFPFWSPDSKSIAFYSMSNRTLERIALGGARQRLCEAPNFEGGAWNRQDVILFSTSGVLQRVAAGGGACTPVTKPAMSPNSPVDLRVRPFPGAPGQEESHRWPHFLPDGNKFLYVVRSTDANVEGVYASSLDDTEQRTKLVSGGTKALFAPPHAGQPGYLLYLQERKLVAQRFDPTELRPEGSPISLVEDIRVGGGALNANRAAFWISENGLLVYRAGAESGRYLAWLGRDGTAIETVLEEESDGEVLNNLRLSPNGARLAVERNSGDTSDLWVYEISTHRWQKLTSTPGRDGSPVWSPDGQYLVYAAEREGSIQIYQIDANGAGGEQRLTEGNPKLPWDWSHDGKYLIYSENVKNQRDLWILPLDGPGGKPGQPIPFLTSSANESDARFSPDSKWIAFTSDITGRAEGYVRAFPGGPPGQWPISNTGAAYLTWRANGEELFYRALSSAGGRPAIMAAPIRLHPDRVDVGSPQQLFTGLLNFTGNASDDGKRFLGFGTGLIRFGANDNSPLVVLVNWQADLK